jgi:hypothetical protein
MVATAVAVGITGYFVYKVILPNLKDIQLPTLQLPQLPSFTPQQAPAPPPPQQEQIPQPESIPQDNNKEEPSSTTSTNTIPTPTTAAPPTGGLLYDSNIHGKWNNGQKRTGLKKEGSDAANGKGIQTAASGNPTFSIEGDGILRLSGNGGHPRIYIYANNYNARLEGEFMFETAATADISIKIRSRHGHSPDKHPIGGSGCPCGGIGTAFDFSGQVDSKAEPCHGSNPKMGGGKVAPFQVGKWHKFAFSVWDSSSGIESKTELDGKVVATGKYPNPPAQCKTKSLFDTDSYFWLRLNPTGAGRAAFRNIRLYDLGSGGAAAANQTIIRRSMIDEPYLYNGYYGRRRL